mgnify:CR=1 FL=1
MDARTGRNDVIGSGKNYFENSYEFYDVHFEIGGAVIKGTFDGVVTENTDGTHHVKGKIAYWFSDIFQDPYDMEKVNFDPSGDMANIDGVPYTITDTWSVYIDDY